MLPSGFMANVTKSPNGCWHWTASVFAKTGYGQVHVGSRTDGSRRTELAHRRAYELAHDVELPRRGEPDHVQIDHECHNRSKSCPGGPTCRHRRCVNPAHLVARKAAENTHASPHATAAVNARKTHCGRCGVELVAPNIYLYNDGRKRQCKPCTVRRKRERLARLAAVH